MTRFENFVSCISTPGLKRTNKCDSFYKRGASSAMTAYDVGLMLTKQQCCWAKLILWLTDKPRLLLFCLRILFHMYEALKQTQNKTILIVLGLFCFSCKSRLSTMMLPFYTEDLHATHNLIIMPNVWLYCLCLIVKVNGTY